MSEDEAFTDRDEAIDEIREDETVSEFWGCVIEAYQAGNEVDMFDPTPDDAGKAALERLEAAQDEAAKHLVRFIMLRSSDLLLALDPETGTENALSAKSEEA